MNNWSRRRALSWLVLTSLGVAGSVFNATLFFGVDFLFGSIAALIAVSIFGTWPGVLSAVIISGSTFWLWGHPYFVLISAAEVLFVGSILRGFRQNIILATGLFWLLLGVPLVWLTYHVIMAVPQVSTTMVAVKQATNAIFNALAAQILIDCTPLRRWSGARGTHRVRMHNLIFAMLAAAILVPTISIQVINSHAALRETEDYTERKVRLIAAGLENELRLFFQHHLQAVKELARETATLSAEEAPQIQLLTENQHRSLPSFLSLYVTDESGRTIAFDPLVNDRGESTLGVDLSVRDDARRVMAGETEVISRVVNAGITASAPVVTVSAPIINGRRVKGIVSGALDLSTIAHFAREFTAISETVITIVDHHGYVVVSTHDQIGSGKRYEAGPGFAIENIGPRRFYRVPDSPSQPSMSRWQASYLGVREDFEPYRWSIIVEQPMAPMHIALEEQYARSFAILLALTAIGFLIAHMLASVLSRPLAELAATSIALPEAIRHGNRPALRGSRIIELDQLAANFRSMLEILAESFRRLREAGETLAERNAALKKEVLVRQRAEAEAKSAQEQAEAANQAKSQFLANMSHEIRTPLGIILGFADLLDDPETTTEDARGYLATIRRNGVHLTELINDILDLSKVEAGKLSVDEIPTSLAEALDMGVMSFANEIQKRGLTLEVTLASPVPRIVKSDPTRLRQILANLMGNAIKFTPQGGIHVSLGMSAAPRRVVIRIRDTGIGIAEHEKAKLFRFFSQADASTTRNYGGTGLGLILSKRLAERLGGDVILAASRTGEGSTFEFSFDPGPLSETTLASTLAELHDDTPTPDPEDLNATRSQIRRSESGN